MNRPRYTRYRSRVQGQQRRRHGIVDEDRPTAALSDLQRVAVSELQKICGQVPEIARGKWADTDFEMPLCERFYERYEQLYGRGSSFRGTGVQIVTFRIRASALMTRPDLAPSPDFTDVISSKARRVSRPVYWEEQRRFSETAVFDGTALVPGNRIDGPAIIEMPYTTVVVRPRQWLTVDAWTNFELNFHE